MQYFNKFICFLTFGILSLLYQLTKTKHTMKQTNKDYTLLALSIPFTIAVLFEVAIHFINL